jgi:hypothetical protein
MAGKRFNVVRKSGEGDKTKWLRVGVVFLNDDTDKDGGSLMLDMFDGKFYLFPPKDDAKKGGEW